MVAVKKLDILKLASLKGKKRKKESALEVVETQFKKEESELEVAETQFKKEGEVLAMLRHKNIVRLIGVCAEEGQVTGQRNGKEIVDMPTWLLCFEYMPNGNLYEYLSGMSDNSICQHILFLDSF